MSEDLSAELKREVAEAARILREDGHAVRLSNIEATLKKHFPDEAPEGEPELDENGNPKPPPPPKKDQPNPPVSDVKPKRRFGWWPEDEPEGKPDAT